MTELLRFATAGSVDDGKSTLIGRMLYDSKSIFEDQLEAVERTSSDRGDEHTDLALLTDGLRAEREQGITIDVAYRYFATPRRTFIVADTPGHAQYTRNMVTGASTADVALILVDARKGVLEQSRRHAFLSNLLGIPHLVLCVNKMDLVGWSEERFEEIRSEFTAFAAQLGVHDVAAVPVSALHGDNVVDPSAEMDWYRGPTLLHLLEHVGGALDRDGSPMRFPVQHVASFDATAADGDGSLPAGSQLTDPLLTGPLLTGTMSSGRLQVGDEVIVLPNGHRTSVTAIHRPGGVAVDSADAGTAIGVRLADDAEVRRGDMICHPDHQPVTSHDLTATICWMDEFSSLQVGGTYTLKQTTNSVRVEVIELTHLLDVNTLGTEPTDQLVLNQIGTVRLRSESPVMHDAYRDIRGTGSGILIDDETHATVAAAMFDTATTGAR